MSNPVRVLVTDDSAAMRALFCDILDQAKGIEVVGTASNADQARDKIAELKPDVLTLDVEMPGMTGMEFLAEIMANDPMPVVMLSSVTQHGTGTEQKALELGAVDCFPKPLHTSQDEFLATVAKLGEIVRTAAVTCVGPDNGAGGEGADNSEGYEPDNTLVAIAGATGSVEAVRQVIAAYPVNCPATVVLLDADPGVAEAAVDRLRPSVACQIADAADGAALVPGTVHLAYRRSHHVVVENEGAPVLRVVDRDPVSGHRPSADMLLASLARTGLRAVGGLLAADHVDGVRGLEALAKGGGRTFAQEADAVGPNARCEATQKASIEAEFVSQGGIARWILNNTRAEAAGLAA
ncbi:MAG: chemotaxis protein CheB [Erythrobacter sp.]|uniref:chemotaxis protein CheB n=1 Tax=Erythrobacter sp. TaxID=1042 RepID=UPI003C73DEF0